VSPTHRQPAARRPTPALLLLALLAATVAVTGCASRKARDARSGADLVYEAAAKSMDSGNYTNAIRLLEILEARFPFSNQSKQAQLDLIYCYFKDGQREAAVDAASQFERENPTHPRVDYALYMRGRAYFSGQRSWYHRLFRIDLTQRPPKDVDAALSAFGQLVQRFPDSIYAPDARQRMVFLRNRLAAYEMHVARYYAKRRAWVAALNRAQFVMTQYDGSPYTGEALAMMVDAYEALGMRDLATDTRRVLAANYPSGEGAPDNALPATDKPWYRFW
jgi:outer membrane protein assembly factor BamD